MSFSIERSLDQWTFFGRPAQEIGDLSIIQKK